MRSADHDFMMRKSTTYVMFALSMLMEKHSEGQRALHCVFVDLEQALYDRVPGKELKYCMRHWPRVVLSSVHEAGAGHV